MRLLIGLCAGLTAVLAGCGGGDETTGETGTGTGGEAPAEVELLDFFIAAEEAYCGWAAGCGGYASVDACLAVEFFDEWYQTDLLAAGEFNPGGQRGAAVQYLLAAREAGRIAYDGAAAATCLAYVEARGCDAPGTYVPGEEELAGKAACAQVFRGTMVRNGPCYLAIECAADEGVRVACGLDPNCTDACCVGGCRLLSAPEGSPCNGSDRCVAGTYCAFDFDAGQWTVCTKKVGLGQPCPNGDECEDGSFCDWDNGSVCKALKGAGEACWDGQCQPGLFCNDEDFNGNYRCRAFAAEGEACPGYGGCKRLDNGCDQATLSCGKLPGPGAQCPDYQCGPTALCQTNWDSPGGVCRALAGVGEPCGERFDGNSYEWVACAGGLVCDGFDLNSSRCRAPEVTAVCPVPELPALPGEM